MITDHRKAALRCTAVDRWGNSMTMASPERATTVSAHCNATAFVFVPNLCNAKCDFCYVQPGFTHQARASKVVLRRARAAAEALAGLGFREVRFTGGEPTLFANLPEIIQPFLDLGLRYRVLTNAIDVDARIPFFEHHPPERFTISVHDTHAPERFFGVPISKSRWSRNRRKLAAIAEVEATFVVTNPRNDKRVVGRALEDLAEEGVKHIKLILENSRQSEARDFDRLAADLKQDWSGTFDTFRFTSTSTTACRLSEKAFPALELGRGEVYSCCAQVGDKHLLDGHRSALPEDPESARQAVSDVITTAMSYREAALPCSEGTRFCPIALCS
ncbi:radical SAM protein [Amycolatopsis sp. OK19-0408]|uniref:Radical SAM protein n=1 Tax=Amycolatopsis iheyensis TaxID=2945988 RepID=A0A9X2NLY6_9PSEU|nr:radical SAM protein [Amycolatopsis iheyensis]MCR6487200.1 radical SAM protein [Amycolatopsis iheyensis]